MSPSLETILNSPTDELEYHLAWIRKWQDKDPALAADAIQKIEEELERRKAAEA
jgi:hypothetical protein